MLRKLLILGVIFLAANSLNSQVKLGFRAGLSYNKLSGPMEGNGEEGTSFANGIHFGVTMRYAITDIFSIKSELAYRQKGTKRSFAGDSYYIFRIDGMRHVEPDFVEFNMDISNSYLSIPLLASIRASRKWEFFGGIYADFLLSSGGSGEYAFGDRFVHPMDLDFKGDQPGQYNIFPRQRQIEVTILGEKRFLNPVAGAYIFLDEKPDNAFRGIDGGLIVGTSYFVNSGFYLSWRFEYGLPDLTNNSVDISYKEVNSDGSLVFRDDKDHNIGFDVSLGFRF